MKIRTLMVAALAMLAVVSCKEQEVKKDIKIVAHRGYWDKEGSAHNSISSLRNAMEIGVFGTEIDVYVTTDSIPVLFHDSKTSNGIILEAVSYAELIENAPKLENGETIPTLDEFLQTWNHDGVKVILEIKSASTPELETFFVEEILKVVNKHNVSPGELEYIAFSSHVCNEVKRIDPGATVSYLNGDKTPEEASAAGWDGIDYEHKVFTANPEWVAKAQESGLIVNVWTVNTEEKMREMIALGVDYITTDKPLLLREVLDAR